MWSWRPRGEFDDIALCPSPSILTLAAMGPLLLLELSVIHFLALPACYLSGLHLLAGAHLVPARPDKEPVLRSEMSARATQVSDLIGFHTL